MERFRLRLEAFVFWEQSLEHSSREEEWLLCGLQSYSTFGFFLLIILAPSSSLPLTLQIMGAAFPEVQELLSQLPCCRLQCFVKCQVSAEMQFLCFLCLAVGANYLKSLES